MVRLGVEYKDDKSGKIVESVENTDKDYHDPNDIVEFKFYQVCEDTLGLNDNSTREYSTKLFLFDFLVNAVLLTTIYFAFVKCNNCV